MVHLKWIIWVCLDNLGDRRFFSGIEKYQTVLLASMQIMQKNGNTNFLRALRSAFTSSKPVFGR